MWATSRPSEGLVPFPVPRRIQKATSSSTGRVKELEALTGVPSKDEW